MKMRIVVLLMIVAMAAALHGCNIVGPAAYIIQGPPKNDALHVLADVPTVIFIDDRRNFVNPISLRRVIADKAGEVLMLKELLTTTISAQDAMTVAAQRERNGQILPIEEIGKLVGAQQVIYVEMVQFQSLSDASLPRPIATCRVRVIDVESRKRVFPPPEVKEPFHTVRVVGREVDPQLYTDRSTRLKVFETLAIDTGEEIAKVFYRHERKELGGNLNPR